MTRRPDPEPAAGPPEPAITADGEVVSRAELEAAGRLARLGGPAGRRSRMVDGFRLHRLYRALRKVRLGLR